MINSKETWTSFLESELFGKVSTGKLARLAPDVTVQIVKPTLSTSAHGFLEIAPSPPI